MNLIEMEAKRRNIKLKKKNKFKQFAQNVGKGVKKSKMKLAEIQTKAQAKTETNRVNQIDRIEKRTQTLKAQANLERQKVRLNNFRNQASKNKPKRVGMFDFNLGLGSAPQSRSKKKTKKKRDFYDSLI